MYRCESCQQSVGPSIPSHLVTVATRWVEFPFRQKVHFVGHALREKWRDDPGGEGPQVVRQQRLCPTCAKRPPPASRVRRGR